MSTLFTASIVLGLIAGWLRGGSIARLGAAQVRTPWAFLVGLVAEVVMVRAIGPDIPEWVFPLHMAVLALLLAAMFFNRSLPGVRVVAAGLVINAVVIAANGGLMPQAPETLHVNHAGQRIQIGQHLSGTKGVLLPREATHLWWLSDVLVFPEGVPIRGVFSPGDLLIAAGLAWTVRGLMESDQRSQAIT